MFGQHTNELAVIVKQSNGNMKTEKSWKGQRQQQSSDQWMEDEVTVRFNRGDQVCIYTYIYYHSFVIFINSYIDRRQNQPSG